MAVISLLTRGLQEQIVKNAVITIPLFGAVGLADMTSENQVGEVTGTVVAVSDHAIYRNMPNAKMRKFTLQVTSVKAPGVPENWKGTVEGHLNAPIVFKKNQAGLVQFELCNT